MPTNEETIPGQTRTKEVLPDLWDKEYIDEAGKLTEKLIEFFNKYAKARELSPEQVVFAVALTTINMRETAPNGKEWFDECAWKAQSYYDKNK